MPPVAPTVRLRRGRERSLQRGHPWLFSGAIEAVDGDPAAGDTVEIVDADGRWLARAMFAPSSRIACRVWTFDPDEAVDEGLIERRLEAAVERRTDLAVSGRVDAYREVHAESDLLPGIIVDRYANTRVIQLLTPGADRFRPSVVSFLSKLDGCRGLYERSDSDARELEGLAPERGLLWGEVPPGNVRVDEYGKSFDVDIAEGHKTGFYLDQRENRRFAESVLVGDEILDAFCYTGGFTVAALRGGAGRVLSIDSSERALQLAARNLAVNGLAAARGQPVAGDVFVELRRLRDQGRSFDAIVLDPPRFAPTASQVQRAARGYKDINLLALKLLRPGGRLITFSCSGGVSPELFEQIVAGAARDAGHHFVIEGWLGQPADHPVATHFPEGRYLKGLVCRKGQGGWYPAPSVRARHAVPTAAIASAPLSAEETGPPPSSASSRHRRRTGGGAAPARRPRRPRRPRAAAPLKATCSGSRRRGPRPRRRPDAARPTHPVRPGLPAPAGVPAAGSAG
jgi:23S rRNA (cytosine1962-C5)-methyltransferase